eukprot:3747296-Rhodomonas_salina.3
MQSPVLTAHRAARLLLDPRGGSAGDGDGDQEGFPQTRAPSESCESKQKEKEKTGAKGGRRGGNGSQCGRKVFLCVIVLRCSPLLLLIVFCVLDGKIVLWMGGWGLCGAFRVGRGVQVSRR